MTSRLAPINSLPVRAQARAIPHYNRLLVLLIPNPCCPRPPAAPSALYNVQEDNHRPHVQRQRQVVVLHAERLQAPRQPRRDPEPSHLWRPPLRQCLRPCPSPLARAHAPKTARPSPPPAAATRTPTPTPRTPRSPPVSSGSPRTTGAGPDASPQSRPAPPRRPRHRRVQPPPETRSELRRRTSASPTPNTSVPVNCESLEGLRAVPSK